MHKIIDKLRARLVDDVRDMWRWWSVWMMTIGGVLGTALTAVPAMPVEVQQAIPVAYRATLIAVWSVAALLTRIIKQKPNA